MHSRPEHLQGATCAQITASPAKDSQGPSQCPGSTSAQIEARRRDPASSVELCNVSAARGAASGRAPWPADLLWMHTQAATLTCSRQVLDQPNERNTRIVRSAHECACFYVRRARSKICRLLQNAGYHSKYPRAPPKARLRNPDGRRVDNTMRMEWSCASMPVTITRGSNALAHDR